jgi:NADH:ubiquinone reductase (H+-translocating)
LTQWLFAILRWREKRLDVSVHDIRSAGVPDEGEGAVVVGGCVPARLDFDVVILGGGFAGVWCGRELAKRCGGLDQRRRVALVSQENYMVFQPMLAEVAGGSISPRHVVNPIRLLCRGIRSLKGRVEGIDLEKREVTVDTGPYSAGAVLGYRDLVLSLGAEIDLSRVAGMPEHALVMQTVGDAMILRATLISRIEEANLEARPEVRRRLLTFVVVGGGYSGVETAGEVLDMVRGISRYYLALDPGEFRVVLVHSGGQILQTLSERLGVYAERKLRERGLEIHLGERVKAVTATKVYLSSGVEIESATVISTVGTTPHRVLRGLCERGELPHEGGRVLTDPMLRVVGREGVWAAGDCAAVPMSGRGGGWCPPTAQFAMRQGQMVGRNLMRVKNREAPKSFEFQGLGELASIGHRTAVANVMGVQLSGFLAWFLWRTIYLSKLPGFDRKVRVMIDWTLDLFFPRDINLLSPRYTKLYREVHLEAGDRLFNVGEPAFSLYVVKSGRIDLLGAGGEVVRTIREGDFFGERALVHGGGYLYQAVAPEPTQLLSVDGEVILPVLRTSERFASVLARTTAQGSAEAEIRSVERKLDAGLLGRTVGEVMCGDVATLRKGDTVEHALALFRGRRFSVYPVVDDEGLLLGVLGRAEFFDLLKRDEVGRESTLEAFRLGSLPTCLVGQNVSFALELMVRSGHHKCLVTDEGGRLLGILTVMDLIG